MTVTYFTRDQWLARPPATWRQPYPISPSLRSGLTVHHNGPPMYVAIPAMSELYVRAIQRYHMDNNGWSDIAYSWLFDNWGQIFEARGPVWDQFANGDDLVNEDEGGDSSWYTAMWLGGGDEKPTEAAYEAALHLVKLVRTIGAGLKVRPHNEFQRKACPGPELTVFCNTWNHVVIPPPVVLVPSSGRPDPETEDEEDMRTFVLSDANNAIYELVQAAPSAETRKRAVTGREWKVISKFYEAKLVTFPHADLDALDNA